MYEDDDKYILKLHTEDSEYNLNQKIYRWVHPV